MLHGLRDLLTFLPATDGRLRNSNRDGEPRAFFSIGVEPVSELVRGDIFVVHKGAFAQKVTLSNFFLARMLLGVTFSASSY